MIAILDEREVNRMILGNKLIRALSWRSEELIIPNPSILTSDKETKDILIKEADLMRLIQLVNPIQKDRRIRLI